MRGANELSLTPRRLGSSSGWTMTALLFSFLLSADSFCGTLTRKETDMIIRAL